MCASREKEQMNVGRKAQGLRTLECTQEKSGCRLLRLGIKTDAALPARGPRDCIFSGCLRGAKSHPAVHLEGQAKHPGAGAGWLEVQTPSSPDHEVTE